MKFKYKFILIYFKSVFSVPPNSRLIKDAIYFLIKDWIFSPKFQSVLQTNSQILYTFTKTNFHLVKLIKYFD